MSPRFQLKNLPSTQNDYGAQRNGANTRNISEFQLYEWLLILLSNTDPCAPLYINTSLSIHFVFFFKKKLGNGTWKPETSIRFCHKLFVLFQRTAKEENTLRVSGIIRNGNALQKYTDIVRHQLYDVIIKNERFFSKEFTVIFWIKNRNGTSFRTPEEYPYRRDKMYLYRRSKCFLCRLVEERGAGRPVFKVCMKLFVYRVIRYEERFTCVPIIFIRTTASRMPTHH